MAGEYSLLEEIRIDHLKSTAFGNRLYHHHNVPLCGPMARGTRAAKPNNQHSITTAERTLSL
jgi:hypothetical protein